MTSNLTNGGDWISRIEASKLLCQTWIKECEVFYKFYYSTLDVYSVGDFKLGRANNGVSFKYRNNIFASNIDILNSALLPELPKIYISRTDADEDNQQKDFAFEEDVKSKEKALNALFGDNFKKTFERFKLDLLVCGSGALWIEVVKDVAGKSVDIDIVNVAPQDFFWSPAKSKKDVWWIARRIYMSQARAVEVIGDEAKNLKYEDEYKLLDSSQSTKDINANVAEFFEVWDKSNKRSFFVSNQSKGLLGYKDDFIGLADFFPVVFPAAFTVNEMLVPIPDGRKQLKELIELQILESRIENLIRNIKAKAYFDNKFAGAIKEAEAYDDGTKYGVNLNKIDLQGGSIQNLFFFEPIETFAQSLEILTNQREVLIDKIRELSGVSDIMALNVSENETATATIQKGRFGTIRLRNKQSVIISYLKSTINLVFEALRNCSLFRDKYKYTEIEIETDYDIDYNINNEQQKGLQLFDLVVKNSDVISSVAKSSGNVAKLLSNILQIAITPFITKYSQRIGIEKVMSDIIEQSGRESANQQEVQSPEMTIAEAEKIKSEAEMLKAQVQDKELQLNQMQIELDKLKIQQHGAEIDKKYEIEKLKLDTNAAIGTAKTIVEATKD